jgi:hypothetical protein
VTYAGSDYCLGVTVFAKTRGYQKIWAEDQTPEGEGFCGAGAKVSVNDGRIVISTPSKPDRVEGEQSEFTEYSYEWNGKTYRFSGKWKGTAPRDTGVVGVMATLQQRFGLSIGMRPAGPSWITRHSQTADVIAVVPVY